MPTAALSDLVDATIELDWVCRNSISGVWCEEAVCVRLSSASEGLILETPNNHSATAGQAFHFLQMDLYPVFITVPLHNDLLPSPLLIIEMELILLPKRLWITA